MKGTILIVDDEEMQLDLLNQMFQNDYMIATAKDGKTAIQMLNKYFHDIVIVLLDVNMPVLNGYQLLQVIKASPAFKDVPVAMVTANTELSMEVACYSMGAVAVIHKPFVAKTVRKQVDNIIDMYQNSRELKSSLDEQVKKLNMFYENLTDTISNLVEFRELETGMHINRVKGITKILAEEYRVLHPECGLTNEDITIIVRAAAMHDIGKIAIPDRILLKPGTFTDEERQVMMSHTTKGCEILNYLKGVQDTKQFQVSYDVCRYHHERYDGNGYPDKLRGDEIPLAAQFVSLAEVYDALISKRVYKKAYSKKTSYDMIMRGECGVFAPDLIKCFQNTRETIERFADSCH